MEITLANFKQLIDPTILQRGQSYYDDDHVVDLEEIQAGYWQAVVEGTDAYRVFITIAPDAGLVWACDCPYDWGPVCKHVAAAANRLPPDRLFLEQEHLVVVLLNTRSEILAAKTVSKAS